VVCVSTALIDEAKVVKTGRHARRTTDGTERLVSLVNLLDIDVDCARKRCHRDDMNNYATPTNKRTVASSVTNEAQSLFSKLPSLL